MIQAEIGSVYHHGERVCAIHGEVAGGIFLYGEGGDSGFEYQEGAVNWLCKDGEVYWSWGVYRCGGGTGSRGF